MKMLTLALSFVALTALVGCNTSEPGGAPERSAASFTMTGPTMSTTVRQGETETVKISLDRGKEFKSTVGLKVVAPPRGLDVNLNDESVTSSERGEVQMTVKAANDAPLGDHVIRVTGTPDAGSATTLDVKVTVKEKK